MPVVVYKEEVMGRRCSVAFQIDRHRALQYYAGRITKYRCEMELVDTGQDEDDNKRIAITCEHHICFEDGDEVWVDLADRQRSGNLKWLNDGIVKEERNHDGNDAEAAATVKQECTNEERAVDPERDDCAEAVATVKQGGPAVAVTPPVAAKAPTAETRPVKRKRGSASLDHLCSQDKWQEVLDCVHANPSVATTPFVMGNRMSTTILHKAICSRSETAVRAKVISAILSRTPEAAAVRNGYRSLPLHMITQRNVKMDTVTRERLVFQLVEAFPGALMEKNGISQRTPLHILFTDFTSPRLTKMMIDNGRQACFMKDKRGFLPAHVACSRHCSPAKLRMLLAVNPDALFQKTNDNDTMLDLAKRQSTKKHPNNSLMDELVQQMQRVASKLGMNVV